MAAAKQEEAKDKKFHTLRHDLTMEGIEMECKVEFIRPWGFCVGN